MAVRGVNLGIIIKSVCAAAVCFAAVACEESTVDTDTVTSGLSQPVSQLASISFRFQTQGELVVCESEMKIDFREGNAFISKRFLGCGGELTIGNFTKPAPTAINRVTNRTVTCTRPLNVITCDDGSQISAPPSGSSTDERRVYQVNEQLLLDAKKLSYQTTESGRSEYTSVPGPLVDVRERRSIDFSSNERFMITFDENSCTLKQYSGERRIGTSIFPSNLSMSIGCSLTYLQNENAVLK